MVIAEGGKGVSQLAGVSSTMAARFFTILDNASGRGKSCNLSKEGRIDAGKSINDAMKA